MLQILGLALCYLLAGALIVSIPVVFLLVTWLQVKEAQEC